MTTNQIDKTKERSPKDSKNIGKEIAAFFGLFFGLLTLTSPVLILSIAENIGKQSLSAHINRDFHKLSKSAAKEYNVSPPKLTLRSDPHSSLTQLAQCNLKSPQNNLVNYCKPFGAYIEPDTLNRLAGDTYTFTADLNIYRWAMSNLPRDIAILAIAKHIADEKGLGRDPIERTEIEYCLVGSQASSLYGTSESTLQYFLDEHLSRTAVTSRENISPVQQQIAIAKGWSGEACY